MSVEDFAGRAIGDAPSVPRELMDAFFPPSSPSGRAFRRITVRSFEELLMLVAAGQIVHPTVASFPNHYALDGIAHTRGISRSDSCSARRSARSVIVCKGEVGTANGSGQL